MNETTTLPLWKNALAEMRENGLTYGNTWEASFFEKHFRQQRTAKEFAFEMMALRSEIEREDGYYLKSSEDGALWHVVKAAECEAVASNFDRKMRRYAVRSINLRSATLLNPAAELTPAERQQMEASLERASIRLVLIARSQSVADVVSKHAPKLLERKSAE